MRFIQRVAVAALTAAIAAATAANGAVPSSPTEQTATADLNKKIADDNFALDASEKAKQEAYGQQVKQQQAQYEQQKAEYERQVEEQKVAYQRQLEEQKSGTPATTGTARTAGEKRRAQSGAFAGTLTPVYRS